jgi:hypothetical protein
MTQFRDTPTLSLTAAADLDDHRLIKFDANGDAVYAGATEQPIGFTQEYVASGRRFTMFLLNKMGTFVGTASGAINKLADVYCGANGKLTATVGTNKRVGLALEAATADGDKIEVLLQ